MRTISSSFFRSPQSLEATGKVPKGYTFVSDGTDKKAGRIGAGFGGEALVCLLPNDNGQWFRDLVTDKECWISETPKESASAA